MFNSFPFNDRAKHYASRQGRDGFTLLETLLAIGAASVLVMGLATAIRLSAATMAIPVETLETDPLHPLSMVQEDLSQATALGNVSISSVTATVPDRNGDGNAESIRYRVVSGRLERSENNAAFTDMGVAATGMAFETRPAWLAAANPYSPPLGRVILESSSSNALLSTASSMVIARPPGTRTGDLLVYGIAMRGNQENPFSITGTWNVIDSRRHSGTITLCTGWRLATATEPATYTASWAGQFHACGTIVRLSGASSSPISATSTRSGSAPFPQSGTTPEPFTASLAGTEAHSILRFAVFDRDAINQSASGIRRHAHLPLLQSPGSSPQVQSLVLFRDLSGGITEPTNLSYRTTSSTAFVVTSMALSPAN